MLRLGSSLLFGSFDCDGQQGLGDLGYIRLIAVHRDDPDTPATRLLHGPQRIAVPGWLASWSPTASTSWVCCGSAVTTLIDPPGWRMNDAERTKELELVAAVLELLRCDGEEEA